MSFKIFNSILAERPVRNWFDLSRDNKVSFRIGQLVPVMCEPVMPTDDFNISSQSFVRFAPMLHPVLHKFDVRLDYFFVPMARLYDYNLYNRIVTGGVKGNLDTPRFGLFWRDIFKSFAEALLGEWRSWTDYADFYDSCFKEKLSQTDFVNLFGATSSGVPNDADCAHDFYTWAFDLWKVFFNVGSLGDYLRIPSSLYYNEDQSKVLKAFPYAFVPGSGNDKVKYSNDTASYHFYLWLYNIKDLFCNLEPFMAYTAVYADYFRDQNLDTPEFMPVDDHRQETQQDTFSDYIDQLSTHYMKDNVDATTGITSSINIFKLRNRAYSKDYFTSALPSALRGPQATLKLDVEGTATMEVNSMEFATGEFGRSTDPLHANVLISGQEISRPLSVDTRFVKADSPVDGDITGFNTTHGVKLSNSPETTSSITGKISNAFANLTATALRAVTKLQEQLELLNTSGGRATEQIYAIFGKRPSDISNNRCVYLGGRKYPLGIMSVLATAETTSDEGTTPLGAMAGQGVAADGGSNIHCFTDNYGFIICLASVMPKASYFEGFPRMYFNIDRFDFFLPKFEHLGEQAILNAELLASHPNPLGTFGYTPRYAEYKSATDEIHGAFRHTLRDWHAAREFVGTSPALTSQFVECHDDDVNRIFSVISDSTDDSSDESTLEHVYMEIYHSVHAVRPMSLYSTPRF